MGEGSRFWFDLTLSLVTNGLTIKQSHTQLITGYKGEPYHMMIVDDKPHNLSFLTHLLHPIGFIITEATNGYQAIEKANGYQA